MTTSPFAQATPENLPLRAPENENTLATLAMPQGETVLTLSGGGTPVYGILQRSRAMTEQSDYFRMQFKGYARAEGVHWQPFDGDDKIFHAAFNCAWVRVDKPSRSVTFGPKGGINASAGLVGSGLDTFLLANAIAWVKSMYPDYAISPGLVSLPQNATEEDKLQRNAFYASQGFEFEWQDATQRSALFFKDKVGKLLGVWPRELVAEFGGEAVLKTLAEKDEERARLAEQLERAEAAHERLKRALQKEKSTSQILTGVLILLLLFGLWLVL